MSFDSWISEWGNPAGNGLSSVNESIVHEKGTRGTETSKYPEEEKTNVIPLVAASERGGAQTNLRIGVTDHDMGYVFDS